MRFETVRSFSCSFELGCEFQSLLGLDLCQYTGKHFEEVKRKGGCSGWPGRAPDTSAGFRPLGSWAFCCNALQNDQSESIPSPGCKLRWPRPVGWSNAIRQTISVKRVDPRRVDRAWITLIDRRKVDQPWLGGGQPECGYPRVDHTRFGQHKRSRRSVHDLGDLLLERDFVASERHVRPNLHGVVLPIAVNGQDSPASLNAIPVRNDNRSMAISVRGQQGRGQHRSCPSDSQHVNPPGQRACVV